MGKKGLGGWGIQREYISHTTIMHAHDTRINMECYTAQPLFRKFHDHHV